MLQYVVSDINSWGAAGTDCSCLDALYLIHLTDDSLQEIVWHSIAPSQSKPAAAGFFYSDGGPSAPVYELLSACRGRQVRASQAWSFLSG